MFRKGWAEDDLLAEHEIPRDPALPQLAMMFDPCAMTEVLQSALPVGNAGPRLEIARCRIVNVSYRPGRECQVSYALGTDGPKGGREDDRFVTARAMSEERAQRILDRRLTTARDQGVAFASLSDPQMVLNEFPNDLRVHALHRLIDAGEFERVARIALGRNDSHLACTEGEPIRVSIISYRPERSCLLRCVLDGNGKQARVVYARIYRDDRVAHVYQAMAALWNGNARRAGRLSVAKPLGYDPEARVLFQAPVDGVPLVDLIGEADFLDLVAITARSLAAIHQSPVCLDRSRCPVDDLDWIALIAHGFVRVLPEAGEQLMQILEQLQRSAPSLPEQDRRMIHGDFSINQVLATAGNVSVSVIDFDDACMGDLYADLGTLLARLHNRIPDPALRGQTSEAFRRQYETAAQIKLAPDRLLWYQATAFARLALSSLARIKHGWRQRVDENLDRAQKLLGGHSI